MNHRTNPMLTRSEVAAILGVHISTVRRLEGRDLHPIRDANGVHRFDRREVEDLAARRGRAGRPSGAMAARVYQLLRDRKTIGEIVCETELTPAEVRAIFEQLTTPLGQRTREERDAQERREANDHDESVRELEREERERRARRR